MKAITAVLVPPDRPADWFYRGIVGLVVVVVCWELLTPLAPAVTAATMKRFHLRTGNFAAWAAQFPIPAMYNFSNRARVGVEIEDLISIWGDETSFAMEPWEQMNHFPARGFTFANVRWRYLRQHEPRRFELESTYRGRTLNSVYDLVPIGEREFEVRRTNDN